MLSGLYREGRLRARATGALFIRRARIPSLIDAHPPFKVGRYLRQLASARAFLRPSQPFPSGSRDVHQLTLRLHVASRPTSRKSAQSSTYLQSRVVLTTLSRTRAHTHTHTHKARYTLPQRRRSLQSNRLEDLRNPSKTLSPSTPKPNLHLHPANLAARLRLSSIPFNAVRPFPTRRSRVIHHGYACSFLSVQSLTLPAATSSRLFDSPSPFSLADPARRSCHPLALSAICCWTTTITRCLRPAVSWPVKHTQRSARACGLS
ncbi:hypothetical protein EV126DRAFT_121027 [Verticillium dahliae]|nr:hypothetical protein EV126DRAFT_121027 [Verticillium dahliae]